MSYPNFLPYSGSTTEKGKQYIRYKEAKRSGMRIPRAAGDEVDDVLLASSIKTVCVFVQQIQGKWT